MAVDTIIETPEGPLTTEVEEDAGPSARVDGGLATQEELDRLAEYVAACEAVNGPVPEWVRQEVIAAIAEADAIAGHQR